ncbi:MAG: AtpZ/AtpI family protein [Lachnospiraceae bacterium]|nr:AtpZ/AtpI family protein [Lachnospiraceae bacterium]
MKAIITITEFGLDMIVPIFLCSMLGRWLDGKFGTSWIFIVMFFIGAAAGASNVYRMAKRIMKDTKSVRNRDLATGPIEPTGTLDETDYKRMIDMEDASYSEESDDEE